MRRWASYVLKKIVSGNDLAAFDRTEHVKIDFMNGEGPWRTARTSAHPDAGLRAHLKGPRARGDDT